MARDYNQNIADRIREFLDKDNWHYSFESENGTFQFSLNLQTKMKKIQYVIFVNEENYSVYASSPVSADADDPEEMLRMAEFTCRANFGLRNGNFELDFNDGELRYKTFVNCKENLPTFEEVRESIICPAAMYKRYGNGIVQILFTDTSAKDAVVLCEGNKAATETDRGDDDSEEEEQSARVQALLRLLQSKSEGSGDDDPDDTLPDSLDE